MPKFATRTWQVAQAQNLRDHHPFDSVKGGLAVTASANPAVDQTNAGSNDTLTSSSITDQ